ncbi:MAG: hypothetical protein ACXWYQ_07085 [Actinomycetota bacterium]
MQRERDRGARAGVEQEIGVLWRILLVTAGSALAMSGWALIMTALLSFIGLPMFIVGVALIQSAERR